VAMTHYSYNHDHTAARPSPRRGKARNSVKEKGMTVPSVFIPHAPCAMQSAPMSQSLVNGEFA
jgi:hypothetical protein